MIEKFPLIRQAVVYCTPVEAGRKVGGNNEKEREKKTRKRRGKEKEKDKVKNIEKRNKMKEWGNLNY